MNQPWYPPCFRFCLSKRVFDVYLTLERYHPEDSSSYLPGASSWFYEGDSKGKDPPKEDEPTWDTPKGYLSLEGRGERRARDRLPYTYLHSTTRQGYLSSLLKETLLGGGTLPLEGEGHLKKRVSWETREDTPYPYQATFLPVATSKGNSSLLDTHFERARVKGLVY